MIGYEDTPESDSQWLKAADNLGFAETLIICDVTQELVKDINDPSREIAKTFLHFNTGLVGLLMLNPTNNAKCQDKWTDTTQKEQWVGRQVFVTTKEYTNFPPGWDITPLEHLAQTEMEFDSDIPFDDKLDTMGKESKAAKKARKAEKKARKAAKKAAAK